MAVGDRQESRSHSAFRGAHRAGLIRTSGRFEPPGVGGFAEAEATCEARALEGNQKLVVGAGLDGDVAGVDAADGATIATEGAFVIEVAFAVVADAARGKRKDGDAEGFAGELPGEQGIAGFEHEVPMLAIVQGVV